VPFGRVEVVFVEEGIFKGNGLVLEMVDGNGGEGVKPVSAGEAGGGLAQFADLGESGRVLDVVSGGGRLC
jgi:hypothetical protein